MDGKGATVWTLVFIIFIDGELKSTALKTFNSMYDCFSAREELSVTAGGKDGYYPPDSQAICVYRGQAQT